MPHMASFFHTVLYTPIYNLLVFLVDHIPGGDIGLAVIAVTIIVRVVIMPLSFAAQKTARATKRIEPALKRIREELKDDKEAQARQMMALYKENGINPFASILVLLIQLPVLICLFWVFHNKSLLTIDPALLYSFVSMPQAVSPLFLGVISLTSSSLLLAGLAVVTQYFLAVYAIPKPPSVKEDTSMQADISRAMAIQMRYVFPLLMGAVAFTSGAIALYFITGNLFGLVQEYFVRKHMGESTSPVRDI